MLRICISLQCLRRQSCQWSMNALSVTSIAASTFLHSLSIASHCSISTSPLHITFCSFFTNPTPNCRHTAANASGEILPRYPPPPPANKSPSPPLVDTSNAVLNILIASRSDFDGSKSRMMATNSSSCSTPSPFLSCCAVSAEEGGGHSRYQRSEVNTVNVSEFVTILSKVSPPPPSPRTST
jgi:hypothetical protein